MALSNTMIAPEESYTSTRTSMGGLFEFYILGKCDVQWLFDINRNQRIVADTERKIRLHQKHIFCPNIESRIGYA